MESRFLPASPINLQIIVHDCDVFSHIFLRIVKCSSVNRLQFSLVNVFISPIGFSCFTTLNVIYLRRFERDVVVLKCCSKRKSNDSGFFLLLSRCRIVEK